MNTPYYPNWQNPIAPVVPVQVHWQETPNEKPKRKIYYILEVGEALQYGDAFWHQYKGGWFPTAYPGDRVNDNEVYRREVLK